MNSLQKFAVASTLWLGSIGISTIASAGATVIGDLKKWHSITISFAGPIAGETNSSPNPFLDYRLQVTLTGPSGQTYNVPGFFDGDGKGNGSGNIWRVHFTPDQAGLWNFEASFRKGDNIAVGLNPTAGTATAFDGTKGNFTVADRDTKAAGFHKWGRLEYAGKHYLKFRDGPYWIKGGTDSPEDLLAYEDFDDTRSGSRFAVKKYTGHVRDWRPGDPDWKDGRGKAIIGAMNYLAEQHVNLIYFLPMNIGGDGQNVWPFAGRINPAGDSDNDNTHYDISKLQQWEIVFSHAQAKGIVLHFVFNEAEKNNKLELGGKRLTTERKLFYREMVARFGHHNALIWNLCEEYNIGLDLGPQSVREFAAYVVQLDPYDHPITVHHAKNPITAWKPFLGDELFSITSLQIGRGDIEQVVETFRKLARQAGRLLPIAVDEFTVTTDDKPWIPVDDSVALRKEKLWPAYLSGGQVEFILAELLDTQDFRKYEDLWKYIWYARNFMEQHLPFWEMESADELLTEESIYFGKTCTHDGQVFAKKQEVYAIYLPNASPSGILNLSDVSGAFQKRWYNPRNGRFEGSTTTVNGGDSVSLGKPPSDASEDWVILFNKKDDTRNTTATILKANPDNVAGRPGNGFKITYRWQVVPMDKDYTIFVHFVDKDGKIVLQDDHNPPTPTSRWCGKVEYTRAVPLEQWQVKDERTVYVGLPEGKYSVYVGLYDKNQGRKALNMGPGVLVVSDKQYKIGILTVDANAPIPEPGERTLDLTEYHLTFNDEFNDLSVSAWGPAGSTGTRWIAHTPWHGDFGDARFIDPKPGFPFTVKDGFLRIEARKENERWRSGLLSAVDPNGNGFKQKYGYFECRAKFPKGPGTWPAFWLMGLKNLKGLPGNTGPRINPEIDVVEHYGHWPWRLHYVLHQWGRGGAESKHDGKRFVVFGVEEDFHTYGVMIDAEYIILYFDGVELHRDETPESVKTPLFPLVNLALGPGWPTDKTPNPSYMYVDYVKVWKKGKAPP